MKKYYLGVLLLMVSGTVFAANGDIVVDQHGTSVGKAEVDSLLKSAPVDVQLNILKRKTDLQEKLQELYLAKVIADEVKKKPLTAEAQKELDETLKMFYFNLKIKQLSEQDLPDFEPMAAIDYKANKQTFIEPEQVAVEHILLAPSAKRSQKDSLKLAKDIVGQLKKGADFSTLALKYSDDPKVKEDKGRLAYFPKGKLIKAYEDVAYKLKLNEVSEPFSTQFGVHILKKYGEKPSRTQEYAEAKAGIIAKIKNEYIQNRLKDFYTKTKTDNGMKTDEKALDAYIAEKIKLLEAGAKVAPVAVKK